MIDSILGNRNISQSMTKLQKVSSDHRFRIKSLRMKTIENPISQQHLLPDKDYEKQLNQSGWTTEWLRTLYEIKCEQAKIKSSDIKFRSFIKSFYCRLESIKSISLVSFNFQKLSTAFFLQKFIQWNTKFRQVNLSQCVDVSLQAILKMLKNNHRILKLTLNNMSLDHSSMKNIFEVINEQQVLFQLDISNLSSQQMNRFGETNDILYNFTALNKSVAIFKADNMNLRKVGVENILRGITINKKDNPLMILSLKNNFLGEQTSSTISELMKSGLTHLNIAENDLGLQFFKNLSHFKYSTIQCLNLSATNMNSEAFIILLEKLQENKTLSKLIVDKNDFSHHWFTQVKNVMEYNYSLQTLSLIDCKIKDISAMFEGITHNRYLKRLIISNNGVDNNIEKLCLCIEINKFLHDIKMRFCGFKQQHFIQIFKSLSKNKSIRTMDISQNNLGQNGALSLLKSLQQNNKISNIITDKVQISVRTKRQIDLKLKSNRVIQQKYQFAKLKQESNLVKKQDTYSWEDLEVLQNNMIDNAKIMKTLENKVQTLQKTYEFNKNRFGNFIKDKKQEQKRLQEQEKQKIKRNIDIVNKIQTFQSSTQKKFMYINTERQSQKEMIQRLQNKIKQQNEKIRKRENQLEDYYKDSKYIKKKQQKKTNFDNTTSIAKNKKT